MAVFLGQTLFFFFFFEVCSFFSTSMSLILLCFFHDATLICIFKCVIYVLLISLGFCYTTEGNNKNAGVRWSQIKPLQAEIFEEDPWGRTKVFKPDSGLFVANMLH